MQKSIVSNHMFLFVCYKAGSGGENLATKISKFDNCVPLDFYKTPEDRTVIVGEFFKKIFLNVVGPFEKLLENAQKIIDNTNLNNKIHVVPSHWDYPWLVPYFPNSKFVRIIFDDFGIEKIQENKLKKIDNGKFNTFLELTGFCQIFVDDAILKKLLKEKKVTLKMSGGEILKVLSPFMEEHNIDDIGDYSSLIKNVNVLNIWFDTAEPSDDQILNFLKN